MGMNTRRWALLSGALLIATVGMLGVASRAGAADEKVAWLGVYTQSLDEDLRDGLDYRGDGVIVNRVVDDSPADKAGVKNGDVIVRFNNRQIDSPGKLSDLVRDASVGQRVSIQVIRKGQRRTLNLTLGERERAERGRNAWSWESDGDRGSGSRHYFHEDGDEDDSGDVRVNVRHFGRPVLGVQVHYMNDDLASYFGSSKGALVLEVTEESAAEKAGIKAGDVITKVGDKTVVDSNDIVGELRKHDEGDEIAVGLVRKGKSMNVTAKLEDTAIGFWMDGDGDRMVLRDLKGLPEVHELREMGERLRDRGRDIRIESRDADRQLDDLRRELRELKRRLQDLEKND